MDERTVMTADEMRQAVARLGRDVGERYGAHDGLALVGIQRRGAILAARIAANIDRSGASAVDVGTLDISLYRDDLSELAAYPIVGHTDLAFGMAGRTIVVVDDVLFTGRTIRAAIAAILDHGRPQAIRLAVLVDRGHRELPIRPDLVGRNLPTARDERVDVHVVEVDGSDDVTVGRQSGPPRTGSAAVGAAGPDPG